MVATHGLVVQSSSKTSPTSRNASRRDRRKIVSFVALSTTQSTLVLLDRVKLHIHTCLSFPLVSFCHRRCFAIEVSRYSFQTFLKLSLFASISCEIFCERGLKDPVSVSVRKKTGTFDFSTVSTEILVFHKLQT